MAQARGDGHACVHCARKAECSGAEPPRRGDDNYGGGVPPTPTGRGPPRVPARLERRVPCELCSQPVVESRFQDMRSELVTREANAARTAERFRVLSEKNGNGSDCTAYDRALQTSASIDATIRALCPLPLPTTGLQCSELLRADLDAGT